MWSDDETVPSPWQATCNYRNYLDQPHSELLLYVASPLRKRVKIITMNDNEHEPVGHISIVRSPESNRSKYA